MLISISQNRDSHPWWRVLQEAATRPLAILIHWAVKKVWGSKGKNSVSASKEDRQ